MALNCCVKPLAIEALAGDTVMPVSAGANTVNAAVPLIEPEVAETVAAP